MLREKKVTMAYIALCGIRFHGHNNVNTDYYSKFNYSYNEKWEESSALRCHNAQLKMGTLLPLS